MTEFKKLSDQIDAVLATVEGLLADSAAGKPLTAQNGTTSSSGLDATVADIAARMEKFVLRAAETDPDKKMYGPKMVSQIQEAAGKLSTLQAQFEVLRPLLVSAADAAVRAAEEARRQAEETAAVEAARVKAEAEARFKAAADAAAAAKAEEERRAAEAHAAAELLRAQAEAKRREKDEAARKKSEEEKAAREAVAARAKAQAAELEAKAADERKRRADELVAAARAAGGSAGGAGGGAGAPSFPPGQVTEVHSLASFRAAIDTAGDAVVLVDLYASWCGPCKRVAPQIAAYAAAHPEVRVIKCDADKCSDVGAAVAIRAFPTFHFYWRKRLADAFSGADMARIEAALAVVAQQADEVLTAEAVAASLDS